jgi:hypothetical protein
MAAICGGLRIHHRACYVNGVSVSRRNFDMKQLGADSSHPDDDATADGLGTGHLASKSVLDAESCQTDAKWVLDAPFISRSDGVVVAWENRFH